MSRRLREFPRLRAVAAVSVLLGGMRVLPSCEPLPELPSGACQTLVVASASDHACMLIGPAVAVCGDGTAGMGQGADAGRTLNGCWLGGRQMRCWGSAALGRAELTSAPSPALVDFGGSDGGTGSGVILSVAAGTNRTCAVLRGGTLRCWSGQESAANARDESVRAVRQVAIGASHLCVVLSDQTVQCRGANFAGQSGSGALTSVDAFTPVALRDGSSLGEVSILGAGDQFTCALGTSGQVQCWGFYGQALSRPRLADNVSLGPVAGLPAPSVNRMAHLAVGAQHACSVDQNGGVWCWGANESGQLGDGTTTPRGGTAVAVRGLPARDPVAFVAVGGAHTCVRTQGGEVWCWGVNASGQLGDGTTTNRLAPVRVSQGAAPLSGVSLLTAAGTHTCAVVGNIFVSATTRCWGRIGTGAPAQTAPTNPAGADLQCCAPTPAQPSGVCPNTLTDARNCGRAGNVCPATQSCTNGACGCAAGQMLVGSACLDTQNDVANCGAANNRCALANVTTQQCRAGQCVLAPGACAAGFADCDGMAANGCETNTATDAANCGACRTACAGANGTSTCAMGVCAALACPAGFTDCDGNRANGCEANTATDARNCGRCGRACTGANSSGTCAMGVCGPLRCNAGFQDCNNNPMDGCETDISRPGTPCAVPPTAIPSTARFGAARHVVNIVDATAARQMASYLGCPTGRTCDGSAVTDAFYRYFPDDYDFLVAVSGAPLAVSTAANMTAVRRAAIPGTGLGSRNMSSYLRGSPSRLRGVSMVNQSGTTSSGPMLHEIAHYWGVELDPSVLGNGSHWGAAGVRGELGGFDPSTAACMSGGPVNACPSTSACCGAGRTSCGGACVDTSTDVDNCGSCGRSCRTNAGTGASACVAGQCRPTCATGWADCDEDPANGCEVPSTTVEHCGGCYGVEAPYGCRDYGGGSFGPGTSCGASGQVVCPMISGRPPCATGLVTIVTPSSTICCAAGASNCGGACSNPMTDAANCGACGVMCQRGTGTTANVCTAGACRPTCAAGYADCDGNAANGCESRLDGPGSCGACGTRCAAGQSCTTAGGRSTCTSVCGAAAGQACCASGAACGAGLTCSTSVALDLPPGPISTTCRTTGRSSLPWFVSQSPGDTLPYAPLELYLMGLVDRAGAGGPWAVLDGAREPASGTVWAGTRVRSVSIDDLVMRYGARPAATPEERAFRTAVVIFSEAPVSDAWLANVEQWSATLGNDRPDACLLSFETATGGRATMSTRLGATRVGP